MYLNRDLTEPVLSEELETMSVAMNWDIMQLNGIEIFDLFMDGNIDFSGEVTGEQYGERGILLRSKTTGRIFQAREIYDGATGTPVDGVIISTHGQADAKSVENIREGKQILSISDAEVMNACEDLVAMLSLEEADVQWVHPGARDIFWPQTGGHDFEL